ncbi:MAG: GspH/FimT family pseudopilin [Dokdonella sp.]
MSGLPQIDASSAKARTAGFSLIEMIAVITLIAIILTVVSLSFSKSLDNAKIRAASRDLVAALRYTRGQAIVKGKQQVLQIDLERNTYQAPGKGVVEMPKKMVLQLTTAAEEQSGEHVGGIRFFGDGSSTGGHISVLMGEREWRINVGWLTGEIALEEPPK